MKIYTKFLFAAFFAIPGLLVAQAPIVTFTATPASVCACSNVTFTNTTTHSPTLWTWYFPGGNPSTYITSTAPGNPPPIQYCDSGKYAVSCVVINGSGRDSVTINNFVRVDTMPTIMFTGPTRVCDGISGSICATGGYHYRWSTSDTTSCIYVDGIAGIAGLTYTLQVSSGACFKDTSFSVIFDSMPHNSFIGDTSICLGDSTTIYASEDSRFVLEGYEYTYLWSTGSTADSILVKGGTPGYYPYYLTITKGACALDSIPITIHVQTCTGIENYTDPSSIGIFPNPNDGSFTLSLSNVDAIYNIEIYNVLGEKIYTKTLPQTNNNKIILTGQPSGVYFYRVLTQSGGSAGSGKLVIE
jgi:PKD repeat protein